jgi:hypothetical protein
MLSNNFTMMDLPCTLRVACVRSNITTVHLVVSAYDENSLTDGPTPGRNKLGSCRVARFGRPRTQVTETERS